jgi:predicted transcriptional regulator
VGKIKTATFLVEASSKPLLGKDAPQGEMGGDYMRGKGTLDPSRNPNAYPMTDDIKNPSAVRISINDRFIAIRDLPDDPADHRGILSWCAQTRERKLEEAGTYGYLLEVVIPQTVLKKAASERKIVIRLQVEDALPGGLAVYGEESGRYPLDPTLVFVLE